MSPTRTRGCAFRLIGDGYEYKLFGLFRVNKHLLVVEGHERRTAPFVLGTDEQGRDIFSRILHGTRLSLSIGLIGVVISLVLGILIGGASGYYGGKIDTAIQRLIELLRSIPTIPLWIGLAAALPREFTVQQRYLAITILLSLYAWTEIARGRTRAVPGDCAKRTSSPQRGCPAPAT